jgi:hypothetical protein
MHVLVNPSRIAGVSSFLVSRKYTATGFPCRKSAFGARATRWPPRDLTARGPRCRGGTPV